MKYLLFKKYFLIFLIFLPLTIINSSGCKSPSVILENDGNGRLKKLIFYDKKKILHIDEISYYGKTKNKANVVHKKNINSVMTPFAEEVYLYKNNKISKVIYYRIKSRKKIKNGEIKFFFNGKKIIRSEYYLIKPVYHRIGLDYYLYSTDFKVLLSRRIIKYKLKPGTKKTQQYEHYHIKYNKTIPIPRMMVYRYIVKTGKGVYTKDKSWKNYSVIKKHIEQIILDLTSRINGSKL